MNNFNKLKQQVKFSLVVAMFSLFSQVGFASSIKQLNVDDLLSKSELVFEGKVLFKVVRWGSSNTQIFTDVTFQVNDIVSGSYDETNLTLSFLGGAIDDINLKVEGSHFPDLGEEGIYFVESVSSQLVNPLVGWAQGHFLLKADSSGDMKVMTQNKQSVTALALDSAQMKKTLLSNGVAVGVNAKNSQGNVNAESMSVVDFKAQLKQKIKLLQQASK